MAYGRNRLSTWAIAKIKNAGWYAGRGALYLGPTGLFLFTTHWEVGYDWLMQWMDQRNRRLALFGPMDWDQ